MAQAGIHALVGLGACRWVHHRTWLALGMVLGNVLPDADILAMAVATVARWPTSGLHRTFTHSAYAVILVVLVFWGLGWVSRRAEWKDLGIGMGIGILMHITVDLIIWFRGVTILWPYPELDFWTGVAVPAWWTTFELPAEFLCFALLFLELHWLARKRSEDTALASKLLACAGLQTLLFAVLWILAYVWTGPQYRIAHGVFYIPSLGFTIGVIIRMRKTLVPSVDTSRRR